jgi:hypothetical protein
MAREEDPVVVAVQEGVVPAEPTDQALQPSLQITALERAHEQRHHGPTGNDVPGGHRRATNSTPNTIPAPAGTSNPPNRAICIRW